jgi:hypothetical protein
LEKCFQRRCLNIGKRKHQKCEENSLSYLTVNHPSRIKRAGSSGAVKEKRNPCRSSVK